MKKRIILLLLCCVTLIASLLGIVACTPPTPEPPDGETTYCTVTFKSRDVFVYQTVTVEEGKTVTLPEPPTRSGYLFDGWLLGETPFDETQPITQDITLDAKWVKVCRVRYLMPDETEIYVEEVVEGGSAQYQGVPKGYEDEYAVYTFEKWVTEKDGEVEADLSCITKATKVYAKFTATLKDIDVSSVVDFVVEVPTGRDIKVLQITDTQIIDGSQKRYPSRGTFSAATDSVLQDNCFKYVEQVVARTQPDLILLTGDIVYGEFDDNGSNLTKVIAFMEGLNIPWAPVFGNHDNESQKGVAWQCAQFENAPNCLFKRRELTGNGNYNIGIMQGGKLVKVVYMLDSNGCGSAYQYTDGNGNIVQINQTEAQVKTSAGFGKDQLAWVEESSALIDMVTGLLGYSVSKFMGFHIPIAEFAMGAYQSGYQSSSATSNADLYTIGVEVPAKNGDFGTKGEAFKGCHVESGLWDIFKAHNFDGVFVGHSHKNNVSILYDGIRLTFGLKSSKYDRTPSQLGGTLATISEGGQSFVVEHVYYDNTWDPNYVDISQLNPWLKSTGSTSSTVLSTTMAGKDCFSYYNGTADSTGVDRMLYFNQNQIGSDKLSQESIVLSFDVYLPADYDFTMYGEVYFTIRCKAAGIKSLNYEFSASNVTLGQWCHCEIELTEAPNYEQLLSSLTEIGFYTPSGSTIYFANITVE